MSSVPGQSSNRVLKRFRSTKPTSLPPSVLPKRSWSASTPPSHTPPSSTGAYIPSPILLLRLLPVAQRPKTVLEAISHIQKTLFSPLPENFKGLSSAKVADILQFRARIPPYVPISLINSLLSAPTSTAREISELCSKGVLRKLQVSSRESRDDGGVVPTEYLYSLIRESGLNSGLQERFIELLKINPTAAEFPGYFFGKGDVGALMDAGFLTLPSSFHNSAIELGVGEKSTLASLCAIAATGTEAAVGGKGIVTNLGYSSRPSAKIPSAIADAGEYVISIPTLGPLLALLSSARSHLLSMLRKDRKKGGETEKVLRERWEGGNTAGRSKKWKELKGLGWESVVGECLGRGECEVFEVVGMGFGLKTR